MKRNITNRHSTSKPKDMYHKINLQN